MIIFGEPITKENIQDLLYKHKTVIITHLIAFFLGMWLAW
jgi:hypothetical protein